MGRNTIYIKIKNKKNKKNKQTNVNFKLIFYLVLVSNFRYSNLWTSCNGYVFTLLSIITLKLIYVYHYMKNRKEKLSNIENKNKNIFNN